MWDMWWVWACFRFAAKRLILASWHTYSHLARQSRKVWLDMCMKEWESRSPNEALFASFVHANTSWYSSSAVSETSPTRHMSQSDKKECTAINYLCGLVEKWFKYIWEILYRKKNDVPHKLFNTRFLMCMAFQKALGFFSWLLSYAAY